MTHARQSDRAFGLMMAVFFATVFAVGWLVFDARLYWAAAVALVFFAAAAAFPGLLLPVNRLWGRFAYRLGIVNNYLLLGLFFYIIMFPVGLMIRLFGGDAMSRRIDRKRGTYWTAVGRGTTAETLRDLF